MNDSIFGIPASTYPQQTLGIEVTAGPSLVGGITLTIDGVTQTFDILEEVKHDDEQLQVAFLNQASKMATWTVIVSKLTELVDKHKSNVARLQSRTSLAIRAGRITVTIGSNRAPSEATIKDLVTTNTSVIEAEDTLRAAELNLAIAKGIVKSLGHRKDMLSVSGYMQNTERKTLVSVKTQP